MKKLKALAISDVHLGEPEGLLFHKDHHNIIDITANKIHDLAEGDNNYEGGIEELILLGDVPDLSEAEDEEAYANTKAFLKAVLDKVKVEKIVFIPGNHDHHLWVEVVKEAQGKNDYEKCDPKTTFSGSPILNPPFFIQNCLPSGYTVPVEVCYPYYCFTVDNARYFFDHGHLFSKTIEKFTDGENAKDPEDLESKTYRFMEKIWYETKGSLREKFYDWIRKAGLIVGRSRKTTFEEDSTPIYDDYLHGKILWYLRDICRAKAKDVEDFHFVFGHTHHGGRVLKVDRKFRLDGRFISVWNTGGWLVPSKVFSPDAYIFYIERRDNDLKPEAYKLVATDSPQEEEGDYSRNILRERVKYIA